MKKIIALITATVLTAGIVSTAAAKTYTPFTDTNSKELEIISRLGIIDGYDDGSFKPDNPVTRAEATQIIMNTVSSGRVEDEKNNMKIFPDNYPDELFTDLDKNHWAYAAVSAALAYRIVDGYEDGSFRPDADITEEQLIKIAVTACGYGELAEIEGYPQGYVKRAKLLGLCEDSSDQPATRGFIAQIAYRMLHSDLQVIDSYQLNTGGKISMNFQVLPSGLLSMNHIAELDGTITEAKNGTAHIQIIKNYCVPEEFIGFDQETHTDIREILLKEGESYEMDYAYDDIAEKTGEVCHMYINYKTDPYTFSIIYAEVK